jgi:heme exporter protein C
MTRRESAVRLARSGRVVTFVSLALLAGIYVRAIVFTPIEATQGAAQKIFYLHVPAALCTEIAFGICGLVSIAYLWLKDRRMDMLASSSAEVGVAFGAIILTTGPIWGKPIWGTWWSWDARLTSTLFLFLLFVGYLVLRGVVSDPDLRGRFSAVIGIMGLVLIPFIHLTVYLFRTLHPMPIVLKPSAPSLPGVMLLTLLLSFGVFVLLYVSFLMQRYALAILRDVREEEAANAA